MLDIDKFKNVNDTYGHDAGDLVLQGFAQVVSKNLRKSDIFARIGGEEFLVFLPYSSHENALVVAQKIRHAIETYEGVDNIRFTISIGVSEVLNDIKSAIKVSDTALYKAKENGRNRVED
jgi:diguanylate cyclase